MDRSFSRAALTALLSSLTLALAGCGGGSATPADATSSDTATATVSGVTTPSSVSVVTAKNAD